MLPVGATGDFDWGIDALARLRRGSCVGGWQAVRCWMVLESLLQLSLEDNLAYRDYVQLHRRQTASNNAAHEQSCSIAVCLDECT